MKAVHTYRSLRGHLGAVCTTSIIACTFWGQSASACPGPECKGGEVFPRSGVIPSNHLAFVWQRTWGFTTSEDNVRIFKSAATSDAGATDAGAAELVLSQTERDNGSVLLTTNETLSPGDTIQVEYISGTCETGLDLEDTRTTLTVGPAAETPTELGVMNVTVSEGRLDYKGVCVDWGYRAYAELDLQLAEQALPFADLFMLSVEVDGANPGYEAFVKRTDPNDYEDWVHAWPSVLSGRNSNDSKVLLSADCNDDDDDYGNLLAGTYSVNLVGTLPDGTVLRTPSVSITLECEEAVCSTQTWELDALCSTEAGAAPIPAEAGINSASSEESTTSQAGSESTETSAATNDSGATNDTDVAPSDNENTTDDADPPADQTDATSEVSTTTEPGADIDVDASTTSPAESPKDASANKNDASDDSTEEAKTPLKKRDSGCSVGGGSQGATSLGALMLLASSITLRRRRDRANT